jgi:AcrR family transcriptional regulator
MPAIIDQSLAPGVKGRTEEDAVSASHIDTPEPARRPAPARGSRPSNRRALILTAAAELFHERGYDQVSTGDLASAVGIGPSALYRHFPSKQQLMAAVVSDGLEPAKELLANLDYTDSDAAIRRLATLALDQRQVGVIWDRDARRMAPEDRPRLRFEIGSIIRRFADLVAIARPDLTPTTAGLLGRCLLAVLASPSLHHLELPRPEYEDLLADLGRRVMMTPLDDFSTQRTPAPAQPMAPASRREAVLAAAITLFAEHGYAGVSIDDIGAALGITGPGTYNHFSSKLDILLTALNRGTSYLMLDVTEALSSATDEVTAVMSLIDSYLHIATAHPYLLDLLITESRQLPADERQRIRQIQRDYISEWTQLLARLEPTSDPTVLRIKVQAALTVVNNTARTPHLVQAEGYRAALRSVVASLLLGDRSTA